MSATPPPNPDAPLIGVARHLTEGGLIAVAWSGAGLASMFVAARCMARYSELKRLHIDDYWMIAALIFLIVNATLQTLQTHSLFYLVALESGRIGVDAKLVEQGTIYTRYEFVIISLFWTVLWCVKGSFLALFYRLFDGLPKYRMWWWGVVVFTSCAYVGDWIASVYTCHPPSKYFEFGQCSKPIDVQGSNISISYSTAVDILSDMMIMILPLPLLRKLQVSTRQKMGLGGVFTVGILIIATAIVRLTQIIGAARVDPAGLAIWGLVESSISVIIGSLPALKNVLGRAVARTIGGYGNDRTYGMNSGGGLSAKGRSKGTAIPLEDSGNRMASKHSHTQSKGEIKLQQQELTWIKTDSEGDAESGGHDAYDDEARIIGLGK